MGKNHSFKIESEAHSRTKRVDLARFVQHRKAGKGKKLASLGSRKTASEDPMGKGFISVIEKCFIPHEQFYKKPGIAMQHYLLQGLHFTPLGTQNLYSP